MAHPDQGPGQAAPLEEVFFVSFFYRKKDLSFDFRRPSILVA